MLRFGKITGIDAAKGLYQVTFDEDKLVSGWIQAIVKNTKDNKEESGYDQDEHVACMMDEHCEWGVIIGAIYDEANPPEIGNADVWQKKFKDGTFIKYDRSAKELTVDCAGTAVINASDTITINGGDNDGLVKVAALKDKINALENLVNGILNVLKATSIPLAPSGTYPFATLYTSLNAITPVTSQSDLENPDVKH